VTGELLAAFVAVPIGSYLVGSIPVGYLYARARGVDVRTVGSGNIGATNVGRVFGLRHFFVVFFLDVLKGAAPCVAAGLLLGGLRLGESAGWLHSLARIVTALSAVCGHVLPCWLRFKGGKGVATSLGVVLGTFPHFTFPGLIALGVWGLVAWASRYVSLASMAAAVTFCLAYVGLYYWRAPGAQVPLLGFAVLVPALIVLTHRSNIRRLLAGTENRIGRRAAQPDPAAQPEEAGPET
jgi:glycerol-3-phosphate acyltransferase PlsY